MNKIGILTCIHSNNVCARVGCLAAFQNRTDFFQDYPEDTCLAAMMTCNGCKDANPTDPHRRQRNPGKDRQTGQRKDQCHPRRCLSSPGWKA